MKTKQNKVGRPKNPLWNSVISGGMFKTKTVPEIRDWLETRGFKTHVVNVYQMRKRLAEKGVDVGLAAKTTAQDDTLVSI